MALDEIIKIRKQKRRFLDEKGDNPYPATTKRTHSTKELLDDFDNLEKQEKIISLSGRLLAFREHGSISFGTIKDEQGKVQIVFKSDVMGESAYQHIFKYADIGDFITTSGTAFTTQKGERSLLVSEYSIITKSLRPLPEKWSGLKDVEERYRKRYLDILMNPEIKELFDARIKIIQSVRDFLLERKYSEVETPMLQNIAGGAAARPFTTHLNAMDMDIYLRIAPELFLKRLLVGGYEKVFEMGRNFRNEGVDYSHNPEFTMLELYSAYQDEKDGMELVENMMDRVLKDVKGSTIHNFEDNEIKFEPPYYRIEFNELLMKYADIKYEDYNFDSLKKKAEELDIKIGKDVYTKSEVADEIYKKHCRKHLIQPTFIIHYPIEMVPLAKPLDKNPQYARSFQLVVGGVEMVKGYSEANDPVKQKEELEKQQEYKDKGDDEAHSLDTDFIEALEYGMPPAFGIGMGIDRLASFITNTHALREIILFPTMKNKE